MSTLLDTTITQSGSLRFPTGNKKAGADWVAAIFQLDVVNADTDAGDTLDVAIQHSVDNGQNWTNFITFTQIIGTAAPGSEQKTWSIYVDGPVGQDWRVNWTVVDSGTDNASFTIKLLADITPKGRMEPASLVIYDNDVSGLTADTMQAGIDELASDINNVVIPQLWTPRFFVWTGNTRSGDGDLPWGKPGDGFDLDAWVTLDGDTTINIPAAASDKLIKINAQLTFTGLTITPDANIGVQIAGDVDIGDTLYYQGKITDDIYITTYVSILLDMTLFPNDTIITLTGASTNIGTATYSLVNPSIEWTKSPNA